MTIEPLSAPRVSDRMPAIGHTLFVDVMRRGVISRERGTDLATVAGLMATQRARPRPLRPSARRGGRAPGARRRATRGQRPRAIVISMISEVPP
jgi:hypothetical protein